MTAKLAGVGFTLSKTEEGRRERGRKGKKEKKKKMYCPWYEKEKDSGDSCCW
jgi:hypothetical protein